MVLCHLLRASFAGASVIPQILTTDMLVQSKTHTDAETIDLRKYSRVLGKAGYAHLSVKYWEFYIVGTGGISSVLSIQIHLTQNAFGGIHPRLTQSEQGSS